MNIIYFIFIYLVLQIDKSSVSRVIGSHFDKSRSVEIDILYDFWFQIMIINDNFEFFCIKYWILKIINNKTKKLYILTITLFYF